MLLDERELQHLLKSTLISSLSIMPKVSSTTLVSRESTNKMQVSMVLPTKSSLNRGQASSWKSRPKSNLLKIRTMNQVQTFFKDRSLSATDAYIRDCTTSEGHEFLKALDPNSSFPQRVLSFDKEKETSSKDSTNNVLEETLVSINKEAADFVEIGINVPPLPSKELDDVCVEWSKHPFVMPSDEKVFHIRALQKKKERQDFKIDCMRSVANKSTFASRSGAIVGSDRFRKELKAMDRAMEILLLELKQAPPMLQTSFYHREKENLQEFVAKKREIFFVQMSLDTKQAEIRKLEERISQREEALRKSEEMLEEDSIEFDAFLKKNDDKMQEAIKKAEKMTKLKQDKVLEMKKLSTETIHVKAELSKYEEQLEECQKYKGFLLKLTPLEWFEQQALLKHVSYQSMPFPLEKNKLEGGEIEDEVTFFQHPKQLLEIFSDIEVANLGLLQQSQDIEGLLESLKIKLQETQNTNDTKIQILRSHLATLQTHVKLEEDKQITLRYKTNLNIDEKKYEISFEVLYAKVLATYLRCGMEADPSLGAIQMLTLIEAKMEEGLVGVKMLPSKFTKMTEKAREKERRTRAREENMLALQHEHEERRIRSMERARAPIFKRKGKPPMLRSMLKKKKKKLGGDCNASDEIELQEFLAREY